MQHKSQESQAAFLLLEDGTLLEGVSVGAKGTTGGEICFNTGMTGYQEIFTDPSYYGQVIITTVSHVGNYGVHSQEAESNKVQFSGLIAHSFTEVHSRKDASGSLQTYLEASGTVGIADIDTRSLVRHIRSKGAMNVVISSESGDRAFLEAKLKALPSMLDLELASRVSTEAPYFLGNPESKYKVAVYDFGVKQGILDNLVAHDCYLKVFPAKTPATELIAWQPDGYFLSNGPGDPAAMDYAIKNIQELLATNTPLFGICLGHQLLALANGISTFKMHHGHRGLNHPVKNLITGLCEITSQNHGFAVSAEELENHPEVEMTHINLNDNTVEGIRLKNKPAFSVQHHPEANPGPHDSRYLFQQFVELMAK